MCRYHQKLTHSKIWSLVTFHSLVTQIYFFKINIETNRCAISKLTSQENGFHNFIDALILCFAIDDLNF